MKFQFTNTKQKIVLSTILLLLFLLLTVIVRYVPILNESAIGYFIVFPLLGLILIAFWSPLYLIYLIIKKQQILWYVIFGVIITILIPVYFYISWNIDNIYPIPLPHGSDRKTFDKQVWVENKNDNVRNLYPRQEMLLEVTKWLPGKTKNEVIATLGNPPPSGYFQESGRDLIYWLGYERRFVSIDSEWLLIWFDEDDRFERYEIMND